MNKKNILSAVAILAISFQMCGCGKTSGSQKSSMSANEDSSSLSENAQTQVTTSEKVKSKEEIEQDYRKLLSEKCPGKELPFVYFGDYDNDSKFEMFAFVADKNADAELLTADLYYVNYEGASCIQSGKSYCLGSFGMCTLSNATIFKTEEGYGGSGSISHAWIIKDGSKAFKLENTAEKLSPLDGDEFLIYPSAFDYASDGTGHTWKPYYLHWNGKVFEEYGGIKITAQDLCKAKGGKEIIDKIKNGGNTIGEIFYRENGIVNINYHKDDVNMYATLNYENGSVKDITDTDNSGVYRAAFYPEIAVYPSAWPLS